MEANIKEEKGLKQLHVAATPLPTETEKGDGETWGAGMLLFIISFSGLFFLFL